MDKIEKVIQVLGLKLNPRELKAKDKRTLLNSIFYNWLPLSSTLFRAVVDVLPSPIIAQKEKLERIWNASSREGFEEDHKLADAVFSCDNRDDQPVVSFISKSFFVQRSLMPEFRREQLTADEMRARGRQTNLINVNKVDSDVACHEINEKFNSPELGEEVVSNYEDEVLIGFARIFSGNIKVGQKIYLLNPRYDHKIPTKNFIELEVHSLYLMMGKDLIEIKEVSAGNVFGIGGLSPHLLKTATLSSNLKCHNLGLLTRQVPPIMRVAIEPFKPQDMQKLEKGLELLNMADPSVDIVFQSSGERVIVTAGELHLERCLKDLKERFAKIDIQVSDPIVPFRETVNASINHLAKVDFMEIEALSKLFSVTFNIISMPSDLSSLISSHMNVIIKYLKNDYNDFDAQIDHLSQGNQVSHSIEEFINTIYTKIDDHFKLNQCDILAFGPKSIGSNILLNNSIYHFHPILNRKSTKVELNNLEQHGIYHRDIEQCLNTAFQLFTSAGPLCSEPVLNTIVILQSINLSTDFEVKANKDSQLISIFKDSMIQSFLKSPRIMLATYLCTIQATAEVLGRVYAVVSKRKGTIISEEMLEGSSIFHIKASIPVIESFRFADEIRSRTSGEAVPLLLFDGFKTLDLDPFWVPTTIEELEDLGEKDERENRARKYMNLVRKRKGLFVDEKVIVAAEKQRTLKK